MELNVIKIGGNVINDESFLSRFLDSFVQLRKPSILIHGGGKVATQIAEKLGVETVMIEGRRVTDKSMLDVVSMVYAGKVNKKIVAMLQQKGKNAVGLSGADGNCIQARKRLVENIDYGYVGDIEHINEGLFSLLLNQAYTPVLCPLSYSRVDGILNTNADTIASEVARAMSKNFEVNLTYCFEKKGVLRDVDDENSVITQITKEQYQNLKAENVIFEGMIPKLDNAFESIEAGVKKVIICHADDLLSSVEKMTTGTRIML